MDTNKNEKDQQTNQGAKEEVNRSGGAQHASADQGGTTDLDNSSNSGPINMPERGSGISTKRNVTGSDYDGQVTP